MTSLYAMQSSKAAEYVERNRMSGCDVESLLCEREELCRNMRLQTIRMAEMEEQIESLQEELCRSFSSTARVEFSEPVKMSLSRNSIRTKESAKEKQFDVYLKQKICDLLSKENGQSKLSVPTENTKWMVKKLQATLLEKDKEICELYMQLSTQKKLLNQMTNRHIVPLELQAKTCEYLGKAHSKGLRQFLKVKLDQLFLHSVIGKRRRMQQQREAQLFDHMQQEITRLHMQLLASDSHAGNVAYNSNNGSLADQYGMAASKSYAPSTNKLHIIEPSSVPDSSLRIESFEELLGQADSNEKEIIRVRPAHDYRDPARSKPSLGERLFPLKKRLTPSNQQSRSSEASNKNTAKRLMNTAGDSRISSSALVTAQSSLDLSTSAFGNMEFDCDSTDKTFDLSTHQDSRFTQQFEPIFSLSLQQYEELGKAITANEGIDDDHFYSDRASYSSSLYAESFIDLAT